MNFPPFKMAEFTAQWPAGTLANVHSSNPQPLSWQELNDITGCDLAQVLTESNLGYEPIQGNTSLRDVISKQYHQNIKSDDVVLTSGAQEGIFLVMQALLKVGDHVIAFTPCFEPLVKIAENTGAVVSTCKLGSNWQIDWSLLKSQFTAKTKLLIINFPHNPTGCHISANELKQLQNLCHEHNCWLFSDEVFRGLEHDPKNRIPVAADDYNQAISMGVMSKALALPGIRLGWLCCQNQPLLQKIITIKSHLSICQSSLDARLCRKVIPHSRRIWQRNVDIIRDNKKILKTLVADSTEFDWVEPKASATAFITTKNHQGTDFAQNLAQLKQLLVLPSSVFLTPHQGFRISLGQTRQHNNYRQIFDHNPNG